MEHQKPQLHVSALNMKCMEAFRRRYIEKEVIPSGVAAVVGTGTHKSVAANMRHKIETGALLLPDQIADAARDGVNEAWESGVKLDQDEARIGVKIVKGNAVDKAVRLASVHHKEQAPKINPVAAERPWTLEINDYPLDLVGSIDIQEVDAIRDTKTSGKTPAANCASKSVQLKAYSLAVKILDGKAPSKAFLDYLIDTSRPKSESFSHEPDDDDFHAVLNRIQTLADAMQKGVFVPVEPTHWCCDPKWCGYYDTCRYISKPKQFAA